MKLGGIEIGDLNEVPPVDVIDMKEVYAFFGLAAFNAQVLEKGLVNFAMAYRLLEDDILTREYWLINYESINSNTFGSLLKKVKRHVDIPKIVLEYLHKSLEKRNWLAHNFFSDRSMHMSDEDGMLVMIEELRELVSLFHITDKLLDTVYMNVWAKFGVDDDWIKNAIQESLKEYQQNKERITQ